MENCEGFKDFDFIYILVANPCDARDSFSKIIYIYFKHATKI